jgi:wobble nucleotide-excising tRNase
VTLYKLAKAEGLSPQHVTNLLTISNGDLPRLETKYENLMLEINSLEQQKQNSQRILRDLNNQITELTSYVGHCRASHRQEEMKLEDTRQRRMKLDALVRQFENNNPEYVKIRKTAEEKVSSTLLKGKDLLKLALFSLTESMMKDPDRYISLIYHDTPSTIDYSNSSFMYGQQQQYRSREDYMAMLVEETDKLYNQLVKELVDEILSEHPFSTSSPSVPWLPRSDQAGLA